jgi:hypothetical protein
MGDPTCRPGYREYRLPGAPDHARHPGQGGEREVDVRCGQGLLPDLREHRLGHRKLARLWRRAAHQLEQHDGAWVATPVYEVPETGHLFAPPQQFGYHPGDIIRAAGRGDQRFRAEGGPAVKRTAYGTQAGPDHGVRICPHRGCGPDGQRGSGKFVVGEQHQRSGHRAQQRRAGPLVAELRPEAFRDRLTSTCRDGSFR